MLGSSNRDRGLLAAAGILVAAVVLVWAWGAAGSRNPDFPDGHPFVCADCGHAMVLSDDELFDLKASSRESDDPDAGRVVCSACGSTNTYPAIKCPHCGTYFPRPAGWPVCPNCKKPLPSPFEND